MNAAEQAAYFGGHAPRCLDPFRTIGTERPAIRLDGHGEPLNSFFLLGCSHCGGSAFSARGRVFLDDSSNPPKELFDNPVSLICSGCGRSDQLFDSMNDGYDPEACDFHYDKGVRKECEFLCPCGNGADFSRLLVRFEYPGDLFEMTEVESGKLRAENLFSWFTLVANCPGCGQVVQIEDCECA